MSTDLFMLIILVVAIVLMLVGLALRKLAQRYPGTATEGLRSVRYVGAFYRFAFNTLKDHRWLRSVPIWLTLSAYIVRIPGWLMLRSWGLGLASQFAPPPLPGALRTPVTLTGVWHGLTISASGLGAGYSYFLAVSPIFWVASIIATLFHKRFIERLKRWAGVDHSGDLAFIESALSGFRPAIVFVGLPFIVALVLGLEHFAIPLGIALFWIVAIMFVLTGSIVQGFIFFYVKDVAENRQVDARRALRHAFGITKPLFFLHLIFAVVIRGYTFIVQFPTSVHTLFGTSPEGWWWETFLPVGTRISYYWSYAAVVMAMVVVGAPFVLAFRKTTVAGIFRTNFDFIGRHFVKYFTFICIGILFLFPAQLFSIGMGALVSQYSWPDLLVQIITDVIRIYLAVVFFLALFKFYSDYLPRTP